MTNTIEVVIPDERYDRLEQQLEDISSMLARFMAGNYRDRLIDTKEMADKLGIGVTKARVLAKNHTLGDVQIVVDGRDKFSEIGIEEWLRNPGNRRKLEAIQ